MEFQYYGKNTVTLAVKGRRFVIDANTFTKDKKSIFKNEDVILFTEKNDSRFTLNNNLILDSPGEYEISDVSVNGIQSKHFKDQEPDVTMFKITTNELTVLITGNINPDINDTMLEKIGMIDLLIVPTGGFGHTLSPTDALKVVKAIEPKVFIPTYYKNGSEDLYNIGDVVSQLGMEISEKTTKYKAKANDLSDKTQLVVLEIS